MPEITGYRTLTPPEVELINDGKTLAEACGAFVARLRANPDLDQRWVSIGATHVQEGFMALVRGIAKPTTF